MKKLFVIAFAACVAFSFTSCKSSKDSAYKTAYEEARQAELAEGNGQESEAVEIAPVASSEVDTTYRTEKVVLSSGAEGSLKAFSVVCGSYSRKEGAENIRQTASGLRIDLKCWIECFSGISGSNIAVNGVYCPERNRGCVRIRIGNIDI